MKLVNMKLTAAEQKEKTEPMALAPDAPSYPYGLELRLGDEVLDKLGLDPLPVVGATLELVARVSVTGVHVNESKGGTRKSLELQITDLCLEAPSAKKDAKDVLYS